MTDRISEIPGGIADKLRALADLVDQNPVIEQFPELFGYSYFQHIGEHLVGDAAAKIDQFASALGIDVTHDPEYDGKRYSHAEVRIGGVCFRFQSRTEDYEKATGKTVPIPGGAA